MFKTTDDKLKNFIRKLKSIKKIENIVVIEVKNSTDSISGKIKLKGGFLE